MTGPVTGPEPAARWLGALSEALGARALRGQPLGTRTTYRVGGPAALTVVVEEESDLDAVHRALAACGGPVPVLVLGKGSNLLVADRGFDGLVLVPGGSFAAVDIEGSTVRAGGAAGLPVVARRSAAAGLRGLEWAVGVPGSVGGAVRMNAGGHGSDTAAVLARCRLYDLAVGAAREVGPDALDLAYRHSSVGPGDLVVRAWFALAPGDPDEAQALIAEIVRWRREHQPGGSNAGSVFANPPGDSAGRLIDEAGLKGLRVGSARVSEKHANFIQADEGGSADDVRRLVDRVRAETEARVGVRLRTELQMIGFADSESRAVSAPKPSTSGGG